MLEFVKVNQTNKSYINKIKPKAKQAHLVHYNAYWYGQSIIKDDIEFKLLKHNNMYVGVIAFGQFYVDAYLQQKEAGSAEIIHMVIDENHQQNGYGKAALIEAINLLKKQNFKNILVATHPENKVTKKLFKQVGFQTTNQVNYDGDPLYILPK